MSAKDRATGKQQQITITASSGLSKQEVDRMVREAEANAADDTRRRQEIELRNQADGLVYSTERALAEQGARVSEAERHAVEQALAEAREALKVEEAERLRRAVEALTAAGRGLADAAARPEGTGPGEPGGAARPAADDVVDAEFTDADEPKR